LLSAAQNLINFHYNFGDFMEGIPIPIPPASRHPNCFISLCWTNKFEAVAILLAGGKVGGSRFSFFVLGGTVTSIFIYYWLKGGGKREVLGVGEVVQRMQEPLRLLVQTDWQKDRQTDVCCYYCPPSQSSSPLFPPPQSTKRKR